MVNWTCKRITAVSIVIIYIIVIALFAQDIVSTSLAVINSGQSRTFQIATYVNFNETSALHIGFKNESDMIISMNFTLPHGILAVNEPITINATAILKGNHILEIGEVYVMFPNSLSYPTSYDADQIPIQGGIGIGNILYSEGRKNPNVTFSVDPGTIFRINAESQIIWTIDGDYIPKIGVFFFDGSNSTYVPDDIILHVYPQEQFTQLQTNKVSVIITLALFVFSAVGVATLFFDLWDSDKDVCKYKDKPNDEKPDSSKTHDYANKFNTKNRDKDTQHH